MKKSTPRIIKVWADWTPNRKPTLMGELAATPSRGKEIFSFQYAPDWLASGQAQVLDPALQLFQGPQYSPTGQPNFGVFLDSCPDRWGRVLMRRREALSARTTGRAERRLVESDYLLGVHDGHRMGALRFTNEQGEPFLDNNPDNASPPWTSLRELEQISLKLENKDASEDPNYAKWLRMLVAPGSSLGGARPKASVVDNDGALWIAKFASRRDDENVGAWEAVVHALAIRAGLQTATAQTLTFGTGHHTFLSKRFDRGPNGQRIHFASALTLTQRTDGDDASSGASYLELAEFIARSGAQPTADLRELWRRIVFFICTSNTDDHLRNHGFLLDSGGWKLSPAYDMNPNPEGNGLRLNISETDNAQDLELALEVASMFRVSQAKAQTIIKEVTKAVGSWRTTATEFKLSRGEQDRMAMAFEIAKE